MSDLTDAILAGDVERARAVLRERPDLLTTRSAAGTLPLDLARRAGHSELEAALVIAGAPSVVASRSPEDLLLSVLHELSEAYAAAGWLADLEFLVWAGVLGEANLDDPFNLSRLPRELASDLADLARQAGGWPMWREPDGLILVTMETWVRQYEDWRQRRELDRLAGRRSVAAKHKGNDPEQTCPCSRLRENRKRPESTNPGDVARESNGALVVRAGYTQYPRRYFCVCRACGSRWTVSEEVDIKESETLYHWQEQQWSEKDPLLELEQEEGAIRQLRERQVEPAVPQDGATEKDAPLKQATVGQGGSLEWRWADERGVAYGCRIEGPRLAVWSEGPFGGNGTDYSVEEFLDGRHETVLPAAVSGLLRQALATRQKE